ncbi:MAG: metallophosphoesterase family protein [Candidatus Eisenbacteria bacterium]|uniref:Metallophosphoesterase family protein n=1 Tax=Eiseniibacteriota bacterium TaxID=2212470 RepID=A0A538UDH1_UNCEI|nr:MAG: metallophosphoesterase family protein [Candidatus Eisenbacteria bacterium]
MKGRLPTVLLAAALIALPTDLRAADEIHWTLTGPTSVTLDWRDPDPTMRYGLTAEYASTALAVTPAPLPFSSPGPFWEARLTGLEPDTVYHYSIAGGPDRTFRTMPAPGRDFVVLVESDIGDSRTYPRVGIVQALIAQEAPRFVLAVGDLTYGDDDGQAAVDQHFNDVMPWSETAAYMPAWGNHEWTKPSDDFRNYKGRFDLPHPQASPNAPDSGCCGKDWYWFDAGGVRFIAYPEPYAGAWSDWATHARSLMDAAQADPAIRFIVSFGHRPAYSSGHHAGDATLARDLDALGDTHDKYVLNLNGHSHDYERSYPQHGVTHVTAGIGGSSLEETHGDCHYAGGCPPPAWSAFRAYHHGTLRLRFGAASIHGEALCGPSGDSGTNLDDIACTIGDAFDAFTVGADQAPAVAVPALTTVRVGDHLSLAVQASDPDGDAILALTADLSGLPPDHHAVFAAPPPHTRGTLTWTPRAADTGSFVVTFRAANARRDSVIARLDVHAPGVGSPPHERRLKIDDIVPVPSTSGFRIAYTLASEAEAGFEVVDPAGRVVSRQRLGHPGPGAHATLLQGPAGLRSGVFWLRLTQGPRHSVAPIVVLR